MNEQTNQWMDGWMKINKLGVHAKDTTVWNKIALNICGQSSHVN